MKRTLFSLILLAGIALSASAQPYRDYADSVINHLYQKKSWKQLQDQTHSLLERGIDSYNVRLKAGVAAFELRKYRQAVTHLQKAWEVVPGDSLLNAFYYRALKYSGREDEAALLADQISSDLRKAIQIQRKGWINEIMIQGSLSRNKDHDALTGDALSSDGGVRSYRIVEKNRHQYGLSLGHHLFSHINLSHAFSRMEINRSLQTNAKVNPPALQNEPSTQQYQYYLNTRYTLMKGWSFSISGSYIWGDSFTFSPVSYDMITGEYDLSEKSHKISDNVVALGIRHENAWLNTSLSAGYARINEFRQFEGNLNMVIYPLGNNHFFITPDVTLQKDEEGEDYKVVFQPQIGIKTDPFWISGEYGIGKMKNFFTEGGKVVYNVPETVTGYWGVHLTAPILKDQLNLSARYRQSTKESPLYTINNNNVVSSADHFTFTDQSLMFSISWNF